MKRQSNGPFILARSIYLFIIDILLLYIYIVVLQIVSGYIGC